MGLGKDYEWHSLDDGLKLSKETDKPLMLIIHKSWCGACKAFKPKFAASEKALELSKHFVMVNTLDNDEPDDEKYKPDGGYIPRILFLGSDGEVREEIYNEGGNPQYKFYYYDEGSVIKAMSKAVQLIPQMNARSDEL
ncbi:thioredoxin domain-containing protein 12-like isoform X2 [Macrobrachium rosenbergii]|uniref:thioredoxin domain-containing protein 12-like isoform X2 n=1 Tax=Macrobrachium rosenbergii TaxID=79674 RepID=UPI0034D5487C